MYLRHSHLLRQNWNQRKRSLKPYRPDSSWQLQSLNVYVCLAHRIKWQAFCHHMYVRIFLDFFRCRWQDQGACQVLLLKNPMDSLSVSCYTSVFWYQGLNIPSNHNIIPGGFFQDDFVSIFSKKRPVKNHTGA